MIDKYLFVLPFNELSGSVVSAMSLKRALEASEQNIIIDFCAPEGDIVNSKFLIPPCRGNIFDYIKTIIKIRKISSQYKNLIFYTVRFSVVAIFLPQNSFIYIHEMDFGSKFIRKLLRLFIFLSKKNILVVNPALIPLYFKSSLLPNCCGIRSLSPYCNNKDIDFLKISNFNNSKGVFDFLELARKLPNKKFVLLTNEMLVDKVTLKEYIYNCPNNLTVTTNQELKSSLLTRSKFLLNLSKLNETFGLTLVEAIPFNTVPLSYDNIGSRYSLGQDAIFLDRDDLYNSLQNAVNIIEPTIENYLQRLNDYIYSNFSDSVVSGYFKKIMKENRM